ncbi:hypothetical protein AAFF_G00204750 [Aldrovandia affinis]|uniref:ZP domain-containing protein n=1 Tax=Aldrovandia affinis TaxID=143900 RepID=A0AAD7RHS5_9TELE|nr:hypothetical protein AAFF_G00204750 [Aldrovandia affinis]
MKNKHTLEAVLISLKVFTFWAMGSFLLPLFIFVGGFYRFVCEQDNTKRHAWNVEGATEPLVTDYGAPVRTQELLERGDEIKNTKHLLPWPIWPYLYLPMFQDANVPLVDKQKMRPTHGSGNEPMPENLKKVLLPNPPSHTTASPPSGRKDVAVFCIGNKIHVSVHRAALRSRALPSQLSLGTCNVSGYTEHFFFFSYNITQCGSMKWRFNNRMVYSNRVTYRPTPEPPKLPIRRSASFVMPIFCHYNRFHYSYKIGYLPEIKIHQFFKNIKQRGPFTLTACNAQWESLAPTQGYVIGEPMFFEARLLSFSEDERLFLTTCYVTPSWNASSAIRFTVIENFGCMVDSKFIGSQSRFIRHERNILRFTMDAFLFEGMGEERLYMHCGMFVGHSAANAITKSCTYNATTGSWEELYHAAQVCSCCDFTCSAPASTLPATKKMVTSGSWVLEPDGGLVVGKATVELDKGTENTYPRARTVIEAVTDRATEAVTVAMTDMVTEEKLVEGMAVVEAERDSVRRISFEEVFGMD